MAEISAAQVKALREKTGAGMMDCKKALVEANGEAARAVDLLRERGLSKARGKAGRVTSEGLIVASVADGGERAALVEVNCETDFVAKTDHFGRLTRELAEAASEHAASEAEQLLTLEASGGTVNALVVEAIAKLGENIRLRRVASLVAAEGEWIGSYVHAGGKIGALVRVRVSESVSPEIRQLVHSLCMHVVAARPVSVSRDQIPAAEVDRERAILRKQAEAEGKPANILDKMVEGRLNKFYKEIVLLEQPLVMDPDQSVGGFIKPLDVEILEFVRLQLGEEESEA